MGTETNRDAIRKVLAKGIEHQRAGRLREAETVYREVLGAHPDDPDALHLLGVAARQRGQHEEAIRLIQRAIAGDPRNPNYVSNLGTAFEAVGKPKEAIAEQQRAIKMKPDYAEAYFKLGGLLNTSGNYEAAAAALARATALRSDAAEWQLAYGSSLAALKRFGEAAIALQRAIELDPKLVDARYRLGLVLQSLRRDDEALKAFRGAIAIQWDHDPSLFALTCLLLKHGNAKGLVAACDEIIKRDPGNRRMVSSKIIALTELGQRKEALALLDFDHFVRPVKIKTPPGYRDIAAFNAALAEEVRNHPTLVFEKSGHATRFGGHTGDILRNPGPAVAALEAAMREAVTAYHRNTGAAPDHPVSLAKPERWKLQSWAVVMDVKGHQMPHIHPAAWISGVYYVKVPPQDVAGAAAHAGWIEFGRPQDNMFCKAEPEVKLYEPQEGLMLLFPSYLYHMTVPIETKEQRISIAFDVIPEGKTVTAPY